MTKAKQRHLERVQVIRTLVNYGPLSAALCAGLANRDRDHAALDALPEISQRGITSKMNAMSLAGHVHAELGEAHSGRQAMMWSATPKGREWADTKLKGLD